MSVPANGSSGFTPPLGAGNYAFWVQDTSTLANPSIPFNFGFDLTLVPEPGTMAMILLGLGGLGFSAPLLVFLLLQHGKTFPVRFGLGAVFVIQLLAGCCLDLGLREEGRLGVPTTLRAGGSRTF
jgi:hypothetical protein